ncbi:MAG: type III pantothenate kinase [Actinomycetota bacterium]|nr:type III pantothenate kinase [Actinomycetota bacterium]
MLLAIDVGNTQTQLGVFRDDKLIHQWRASTNQSRTADELALLFGEFLSLADLSFSRQITGVVVASVVPRSTQEIRDMTERYFGFPPVVVEPGIKTGLAIHTDNPREVGADRIANAVAARDMFPGEASVVIDFGTAITVDAVSARGEYLGGAIAPGIDTAASALFQSTAQISRVQLIAPPTAIGKTTVTSVQSGTVYGTAGLVDGLVERVVAELGGRARIIATGGLAPTVIEHCRTVETVEPLLTLNGLRLIYERNAEAD